MRVTFPHIGAVEAALLLPSFEAINARQMAVRRQRGEPVPSVIGMIQAGQLRYERRDPNEEWVTYDDLIRRGWGDCEDLSAAVAAELQVAGHPAFAMVYPAGPGLYHVVVNDIVNGTWTLMDPSRAAGMGRV